MGYANLIPMWMIEEIMAKQTAEAKCWVGMTLLARIITGSAQYMKELRLIQMRTTISQLCTDTQAQFESEQFILSKGFKRCE